MPVSIIWKLLRNINPKKDENNQIANIHETDIAPKNNITFHLDDLGILNTQKLPEDEVQKKMPSWLSVRIGRRGLAVFFTIKEMVWGHDSHTGRCHAMYYST